ncbi:FAD-dependent oxidoreductase [Donghicola sp. XS_ASV15]|uniref:FAD-dependent oxidoreductase n=1 Tax=Donghicola sp. XS_ASV15 TaxID=3241295 RepID=UPI003515621B
MTRLTRRHFTRTLLAGAAAGFAGFGTEFAARAAPIAVIGGGPAGATAALKLKRARPDLRVTLIERNPSGLRRSAQNGPFAKPSAGPAWDALSAAGVEIVLDEVTGIDWTAARIDLFRGQRLAYDRVVLAPGTRNRPEPIQGYGARGRHFWPAAWGSAREAQRLTAMIKAMPEAGHLVLRLPAELSHPQVAQERVSTLARLLAVWKPEARMTVLSSTDSTGFDIPELGAEVTWQSANVISVDVDAGIIETDLGRITADVVNFVTPQMAGAIAGDAGLVDSTGWCPASDAGLSLIRPEAIVLGDARAGAKRTVPAAIEDARRLGSVRI